MTTHPETAPARAELIERLRIKSAMLRMSEPIAFGSDADALDEAADALSTLLQERDELREALSQISRMKLFPDDFINRTSLAAAIRIASEQIDGAALSNKGAI